jgi:hypothetical protein
VQLLEAMLSEFRARNKVVQVIGDDVALLAERAGDERHLGTFGAVAGDGRARGARLVVRMGVDQEKASIISHGAHHTTRKASAQVVLIRGSTGLSEALPVVGAPASYAHH